jgi:ATP-dependent Zn protease
LVYETDENSLTKPYSEQTAQMIDMKLRSLVHELYAQSKKLIADNKDLMIVL